jgi:hypothetical protein
MHHTASTLAGLRYGADQVDLLFPRPNVMEVSTTYQGILRRGELMGMRSMLLAQGAAKFGEPDKVTRVTLEAITDAERLQRMGLAILQASSWQDLLSTP